MKTVFEDGIWKILEIVVEFNALTWLLNMGGSYEWEGVTYTPTSPDPAILAPPKMRRGTRGVVLEEDQEEE